jgi:hypothetical protein
MTDSSYQTAREQLFQTLADQDKTSQEYLNAIKALEILNKAEAAQIHPENPEETGAKAWFEKHSDALIRVGGTLTTVVLVGFVESKFDVIFRSKASKYL